MRYDENISMCFSKMENVVSLVLRLRQEDGQNDFSSAQQNTDDAIRIWIFINTDDAIDHEQIICGRRTDIFMMSLL